MPDIAPSSRGPLIRKGLAIAIASVVLLTLIELHGAVIRQGLRFIGVVSGEPSVLLLRDGCGKLLWVPPALRGLQRAQPLLLEAECGGRAGVFGLLPRKHAGFLFVNGRAYRAEGSGTGAVWFPDVQLQPGLNLLALHEVDAPLLYPIAVRGQDDLALSALLTPATLGEPVGSRAKQDLDQWLSVLSPRSVAVFAQQRAQATAPEPAVPVGERSLELLRRPSGEVEVRARACLPPLHRLTQRARSGDLNGPQFVGAAFQTTVYGHARRADDPSWRQLSATRVEDGDAAAPCRHLQVAYTVPEGQVLFIWGKDFLANEGDRLMMEAFSGEEVTRFRPPDRTEGDRWVWLGDPKTDPVEPVIMTRTPAPGATGPAGADAAPASPAPATQWLPAATRVGTDASRQAGLLKALSDLRDLLPRAWRATLWGLAAAAPVALILWKLVAWPVDPRILRMRAALVALLVFMTAFAVQPLLLQVVRFVLGWLGNLPMIVYAMGLPADLGVGLPIGLRETGGDLSAPIALCVMMMVPPLCGARPDPGAGHRWLVGLAAVVSLLLMAAALTVLTLSGSAVIQDWTLAMQDLLPHAWSPLTEVESKPSAAAFALIALFGAWLVLGLGLFWVSVYGLYRVVVPSAPVAGTAFLAGLLLFLLPLANAVGDAAGAAMAGIEIARSGGGVYRNWGLVLLVTRGFGSLTWLSVIFSGGVVLVVVAILLRGLREIAAAMLDDTQAKRIREWLRWRTLLLVALAIVWPMLDDLGSQSTSIHNAVHRLMSIFLACGAMLALLAPWAAAQELDQTWRDGSRAQRFLLPPAMQRLMCAAFAGYLTLWNREPVAVAVLMVVGWYLICHVVLETAPAAAEPAEPQPTAGLGQRLVDHLGESRLLRARRGALEKLFTEGKLSLSNLATQRVELDKAQRGVDERLGMSPVEARRRLFEYGPGPSPLHNGIRGALAGLTVAAVLQLLMSFDLASLANAKGAASWSMLVSKIIVDPGYQVVSAGLQDSGLLGFAGALLNAVSIWAIAGFIFGYLFHGICGRDGFLRAALFGVAVAIPYLLSLALTDPLGAVPLGAAARVVPLGVFLLLVGTLVFDGATLRREQVSMTKLPEIYGLKTSVGYLSFAGALAGIQPLLDLLGWALS